MAFDKVEALVASGVKGMPASVALVVRGSGGGRPQLHVSFSSAFTQTFQIIASDCFDLLLGTGEQKGLLRLKRTKKGIAQPIFCGRGGVRFALGYIERFGTEPEPKQFCNAEVIDADTVEVVLPSWADEIER